MHFPPGSMLKCPHPCPHSHHHTHPASVKRHIHSITATKHLPNLVAWPCAAANLPPAVPHLCNSVLQQVPMTSNSFSSQISLMLTSMTFAHTYTVVLHLSHQHIWSAQHCDQPGPHAQAFATIASNTFASPCNQHIFSKRIPITAFASHPADLALQD